MPSMDGAVPGRASAARSSRRPLDRLAWVHAASTCGDALVAVALAGTLFFAVPVAAARPRVALYLLLTVAPFAVVAPLLGSLLDGRRGDGRLALAAALGGTAGALLGVGLDRLVGAGVLYAAATAFTAGTVLALGLPRHQAGPSRGGGRRSTRLNSSHTVISYAVFCLKKKKRVVKVSYLLKIKIIKCIIV